MINFQGGKLHTYVGKTEDLPQVNREEASPQQSNKENGTKDKLKYSRRVKTKAFLTYLSNFLESIVVNTPVCRVRDFVLKLDPCKNFLSFNDYFILHLVLQSFSLYHDFLSSLRSLQNLLISSAFVLFITRNPSGC